MAQSLLTAFGDSRLSLPHIKTLRQHLTAFNDFCYIWYGQATPATIPLINDLNL